MREVRDEAAAIFAICAFIAALIAEKDFLFRSFCLGTILVVSLWRTPYLLRFTLRREASPTLKLVARLGAVAVAAGLEVLFYNPCWLSLCPAAAPAEIAIAVSAFDDPQGSPASPQQKALSDGMRTGLVNGLGQLQGLRVIGEKSIYALRGQSNSTIGRSLKVSYILKGAVLWVGNSARFQVQLGGIADDSPPLFSKTYTTDLNCADAASIQVEVLNDAATSLGLSRRAGKRVAPPQCGSGADNSYLEYYKAVLMTRERARKEPGGPLTDAAAILDSVLDRDPGYVPAQVLLAEVDGLIAAFAGGYSNGSVAELRLGNKSLAGADAAALKAVSLNDNSAAAWEARALADNFRGNLLAAENEYRQALRLSQTPDSDVLHFYSLLLMDVGHLKEATEMRRQLRQLEPLVPIYNAFNASQDWLGGNDQQALAEFQALEKILVKNPFVLRQIALLYGARQDYAQAEAALRASAENPDLDSGIAAAIRTYSLAHPPTPPPALGFFSPLHVFSSTPERALDYFNANHRAQSWAAADAFLFWYPSPEFSALRKTKAFKDSMIKSGLVDYWRQRGWPDNNLCHPTTGDDFACQ